MATDIMGLLTGVSKQGVNPMLSQLTPAQQRMEFGRQAVQGMQRGLLGGKGTVQEQLQAGAINKQISDLKKAQESREKLANALPAQYSGLADAVRNNMDGAVKEALEVLSRERKQPTPTSPDRVNLVDLDTDETVGTAVEIDGKLYKDGVNNTLIPMTQEELSKVGVSTSYVREQKPLVRTYPDPTKQAFGDATVSALSRLNEETKRTAALGNTAIDTRRNALATLEAVNTNPNTGTLGGTRMEIFRFGQDFFQTLGINVPKSFTESTANMASYQKLAAEGLKPLIAEQGRGFTDKDLQFFLDKVLPSYKQSWQFNELAGSLQLEEANRHIAESQFAASREAYHITNEKVQETSHAGVWADYLDKLPYGYLDKKATKIINGQEIKYTKYAVENDNAKLWEYWREGIPKGLTMKIGETVDNYTWEELESQRAYPEYKDLTLTQILSKAKEDGLIVGAFY